MVDQREAEHGHRSSCHESSGLQWEWGPGGGVDVIALERVGVPRKGPASGRGVLVPGDALRAVMVDQHDEERGQEDQGQNPVPEALAETG